jgi:hypothetical protein
MLQRLWRTALAFTMTASLAAGPLARPAAANEGQTWTMIGAAAALVGGIILYNNYQHKRQAANTVVGYTRNGGTVYGDGRIVMPNGATIYPGPNGNYPWGQPAYYTPYATGYQYDPNRTGEYDRTHSHGYYESRYRHEENRERKEDRDHHGHPHSDDHGDHN